jgi:hypothetical protein
LATRAVAEHRLHRDTRVHEEHAPRLADGGLAGIELDLDELHLRALDLVVHHIHRHAHTIAVVAEPARW